ncbi:MAG: hypothetical protein KA369_17790 [Spirochaetes bacterium]|nr:hypothetical protein [Spirochaetota bacterium]
MKNKLLFISCFILLTIGFSPSLYAYGLGVYFNGGIGESRLKKYYLYASAPVYLDFYFKGMNYIYGAGLVFDTCVGGDSLVNYRLQVGFDEFRYPRPPGIIFAEYNYVPPLTHGHAFRLSLKNTVGFAFFRSRSVRAWAGVSLSSVYYPNNLWSRDINIVIPRLFSPGVVLGLNYHVMETLSFIFEGGLFYEWSVPRHRLDYMNSLAGYLSVGVMYRPQKPSTNIRLQSPEVIKEKEILKEEVQKKDNLKRDNDL